MMGDFGKAIEDAALPVLLTLIAAGGGLANAWLKSRQRRLEEVGAQAWEHADFLSSSAPGIVSPEERESYAVGALVRKGFSDARAVKLARATRTEPIQLVAERPAIVPPAPDSDERTTLPGVLPPRR